MIHVPSHTICEKTPVSCNITLKDNIEFLRKTLIPLGFVEYKNKECFVKTEKKYGYAVPCSMIIFYDVYFPHPQHEDWQIPEMTFEGRNILCQCAFYTGEETKIHFSERTRIEGDDNEFVRIRMGHGSRLTLVDCQIENNAEIRIKENTELFLDTVYMFDSSWIRHDQEKGKGALRNVQMSNTAHMMDCNTKDFFFGKIVMRGDAEANKCVFKNDNITLNLNYGVVLSNVVVTLKSEKRTELAIRGPYNITNKTLDKIPTIIHGSRHTIGYGGKDQETGETWFVAGCQEHPAEYFYKNSERLGKEFDYTIDQQAEYRVYVNMLCSLYCPELLAPPTPAPVGPEVTTEEKSMTPISIEAMRKMLPVGTPITFYGPHVTITTKVKKNTYRHIYFENDNCDFDTHGIKCHLEGNRLHLTSKSGDKIEIEIGTPNLEL